jgi:hypothetical protein
MPRYACGFTSITLRLHNFEFDFKDKAHAMRTLAELINDLGSDPERNTIPDNAGTFLRRAFSANGDDVHQISD